MSDQDEIVRLNQVIADLRTENKHDTDMLGTLLFEAEKEARYQHGCVEARNHFARVVRFSQQRIEGAKPWLHAACEWCQREDGKHTAECPEQQWPTRRPRRRERTGRPLRLLLTIPNIQAGVKTCRGDGWRCPELFEKQTGWSCSLAGLAQWDGAQAALKETGGCDNQPIRCDGCINSEE